MSLVNLFDTYPDLISTVNETFDIELLKQIHAFYNKRFQLPNELMWFRNVFNTWSVY